MAGQPSKLTPQITDQIRALLLAGNFVETVASFVGIHRDTFYEWIRRGERGWQVDIEPVNYVEFSDTIKKAMSQAEVLSLNDIRQRTDNWQAQAWFLERRHPDKWGNRQKQTNVNVNMDLSELSEEDLEKLSRGEDVDFAAIARKGRTRTQTPADTNG